MWPLNHMFHVRRLGASMHIAEECVERERRVPQVITSAVTIGFCTAFAYSVAQLYALTDIDAIITSTQ